MSEALAQTEAIQNRVADPELSAWVSANAGTGKTFVLVRRVIRQLLSGAPPASIVCITFTKAAAAEMSNRLIGMLSGWALADDEKLQKALFEVTGDVVPADQLDDARKLFARALESPGGLKIQTIHSFCGSVLARFPAEAGLPLGFRPLEEEESQALLRDAVEGVAEFAQSNPDLEASIRRLSEYLQGEEEGGSQFGVTVEDCLRTFMARTRSLATLEGRAIPDLVDEALAADAEDPEAVYASFEGAVDEQFLARIRSVFPAAGKNAKSLAGEIEGELARTAEERLAAPLCFTKSGTPRRPRLCKKALELMPDFWEDWERLTETTVAHLDRLRIITCRRHNEDFARLAVAASYLYNQKKEERSGLDYDDLIERTLTLLRSTDGAWVRFKLDAGIDHVLLDEAQDTSKSQWELFGELVAEIASTDDQAAGASRPRSLFAVGDPKQSIYAFNGAEAALFAEQRDDFKRRLGARLSADSLFLSFRTSQPVLDLVDAAFDRPDFAAVAGGYHHHRSHWEERPGSVELWPHLPEGEKSERSIWDHEVDATPEESIDRRLALSIADTIADMLAERRRLACAKGRCVRPDDVMILFQRRGRRFKEVLRALAERGVPCAGTDRIDVAGDVGVRDLVNLLRFAANTDDSLSLAVLLKSPFFGWSEDELFALAHGRKGSLWRRLREVAEAEQDGTRAAEAVRLLDEALAAGARRGPYSLLSAMLDGGGERTGRTRIAARLGPASLEAIDVFLDEAFAYEDQKPRSVHGFLERAEAFSRDIKREIAGDEAAGVRVMTVHGAKGLEAPIVFLADADHRKADHQYWQREKLVAAPIEGLDSPFPLLALHRSAELPERVRSLRAGEDERREEEYQRLLYVAATRAAEHLVICGGKEPSKPDGPPTWHQRLSEAMGHLAQSKSLEEKAGAYGTIKRYAKKGFTGGPAAAESDRPVAAFDPPDWLGRMAEPEVSQTVIYPSLNEAEAEAPQAEDRENVGAGIGQPRLYGLLVHKLLEVLPDHPPEERARIAERIGKVYEPALEIEDRESAFGAARDLLAEPGLADLFGPAGQAEVAIQGEIDGDFVSGQIDRLLITDREVVIAEFKSTGWVPTRREAVPAEHRKQVQLYRELVSSLYPGRRIVGLVIYTAAGRVFRFD